MSKYEYFRYKIRLNPDTKKRQGLRTGDVVRRQYAEGARTLYSLMAVLEAGEETLTLPDGTEAPAPYFIGALLDGDEPREGELLDFVRLTSLTEEARSGALYLTSSDDEAPYMDLIDGMATERSLRRPARGGYGFTSGGLLTASDREDEPPATRIFRLSCSAESGGAAAPVGFRETFDRVSAHPARLLFSFRIRASRPCSGVRLTFGAEGGECEAEESLSLTTQWQYRLFVVTTDLPADTAREFLIDLRGAALAKDEWCELADLNVVELSALASLAGATKVRVGRITGVADPLFGVLHGYGAYFQNLYATRNVHIAGTLTAADERGFASTFYVGRIHRNCFLNSLQPTIRTGYLPSAIPPPTGVGKFYLFPIGETTLECQSEAWAEAHAGELYCFSFWVRALTEHPVTLRCGTRDLGEVMAGKTWQRRHVTLRVEHIVGSALQLQLDGNGTIYYFCSPQLEEGSQPTLYQPTDAVLRQTDEYGAWFCRGGVGGTIQHPLLRLEADGSIRAGNDSFVIAPDGSGYVAGGAIRWDEQAVTLSERVLLRWENLDAEARENLTGRDAYSVYLGTAGCIFQADCNGDILSEQRLEARIHAYRGGGEAVGTVSALPSVEGLEFLAGGDGRSVVILVRAGTTTLADYGTAEITVAVDGHTFRVPFSWSKARAGADFAGMEWLDEWHADRTQIGSQTVITPKLFAGVRHPDDTVTGVAMGLFELRVRQADGTATPAMVAGISAFREGVRTFYVDDTGSAGLGRGGQSIRYDAATGRIEFGAEVSMAWTGAIAQARSEAIESAAATAHSEAAAALGTAKAYADTKKSEAVSAASADAAAKAEAAKELARAMAFGKMLYRDPTFRSGSNGVKVYNNSSNGLVSVSRISASAPNDSGYVLEIKTTGSVTPGFGGFYFGNAAGYRKIFITRLIARIPAGRYIEWASNSIGTGGSSKWLTPTAGTGDWSEYICKVVCGSGTFSSTNFFYLTGGAAATAEEPVVWQVAYATVIDVTASEGYTTTLDANGIYTGTLTAAQVNAVSIDAGSIRTGILSADRIAAGSIKADKLDAASIKTGIVNASYINGLELTFAKGKIGGWTIGVDHITAGSVGTYGATPIQIRSASAGSGYWYEGSYKPLGISMLWRQIGNAGHFVFGQVAATPTTVKTGFIGLQMMGWEGLEYFCLSTSYTRSGSKEVYNRIAGWAFDHQRIWKNNVSLGADGSIASGSKWKLNNDGSGLLAAGNISWDAAGAVTFGPSVSLQWKNDIEAAKSANYGYRYYKRIVIEGNSTTYYPVVFKGGEQTVQRDIMVRRAFNDQAPSDWNNGSTTHMGGLNLLIKTNFGGWGGAGYSWDIYDLQETYCRMFGGAAHCGNYCMFAVFLRGGGTTGAVYHLYSDQPIESTFLSPSPIPPAPQIAYNTDRIFQSGSTTANAPSPRTFSTAVEEEIRRHRFIALAQGSDTTLKAHPLTYISSTGIYTGTLTAAQVNAVSIDAGSIKTGTLSADRLAAGSIKAAKLDAASIRADIVNTSYINGLTCSFVRGTLGGWTIGATSITGNHITLDSATRRVAVFGASSSATGGQRVQLYYNSDSDFGLWASSASGTVVAQLGAVNRIAGWNINSSSIYSGSVYLSSAGNIYNSSYWRLSSDGSGYLAKNNISWTAAGVLTMKGATIQDAVIKGTLRSPFVMVDGSIWITIGPDGSVSSSSNKPEADKYDNICVQAGQDSGGWNLQQPELPWDVSQSGRRLCLTHYRYGSEYVYGTSTFTAPSGKYFYENGRLSTTLSMSRQVVELMGFGTSSTFYGWIVLNRRDLGTQSRYGEYMQYLAMGSITLNSGYSITFKQKTYDGTKMSVSRTGTGRFSVYLPWSLGVDKYMVILSGKTSPVQYTPIYAGVVDQYASSFTVQTGDDASANDGSFNFIIVSTADFI